MMMKSLLTAALATITVAQAQAQSASYTIDPTHTSVTFEAVHFGTSTNRGRWDKKEGMVELDRAGKTGKVSLTVDMTSINTGVDAFNKHLQSKDFFDTAAHPTAKFVSDKFIFDGDKVKEIQGQLTLMGKTQPLALNAVQFNCYMNPMLKREVCGGDFKGTLKRSQYGIVWGLQMGVQDDIPLIIQVEAIKAQ